MEWYEWRHVNFTLNLFTAGAMKALQHKGIVHRDLKPQNILLSHAGKPNPQPNDIRLKIGEWPEFIE